MIFVPILSDHGTHYVETVQFAQSDEFDRIAD